MKLTRGGTAILLAVALGSCGRGDILGAGARQGIEGVVLIGPQCPVVSQNDPCDDLPYEVSIEVESRDGVPVTRFRSDAEGRFRVGLFPGFYTIIPESGDPFPRAEPQEVIVLRDSFTEVEILFDTGIRE